MTHSDNIHAMEEKESDEEEEEMSSQEEEIPAEEDAEEILEDLSSMKMTKAAKQHKEQLINASYLNVVKEMNTLNRDTSELTLKEVPVTVLAEIRHCVQLLGHINEVYRASAFPLLQAYLMRYPVLVPCAVNNIFFIYANAKNTFQKQAKVMGVGCVLKCDAAINNKSLLRKLVSEIIVLRNPSDRDDTEIFFLVSALQSDSAVQPVSDIILEGMGEELRRSIAELKPSLLWLRVVLAQRMLVTGLKLPVWLKDTFKLDKVVKFGSVIMPKSQKMEPHHPMFENFIYTLASFDNTIEKLKKRKPSKEGKASKPSALAILFQEEIAPAIGKCFGDKKRKTTIEIAYKLLQNLLSCDAVEMSVLERVVQWLGGGGLRCLTPDMRGHVVQSLLARLSSLDTLETEEERSTLAVCVLQGAVVFPEMMQRAKEHLHHLTASAAQACVNDMLRVFWRKLTQVEASLLLRLVALRQCRGKEHLEWRLKVTQSMTRKALQSSSDEGTKANTADGADSEQKGVHDTVKHVNNRDLFFRFLSHCSHDKSTVCEVLIEAHSVAMKEVTDNPEVLPAEIREMWDRLAERVRGLQAPQHQQFAFNKLFQVLFSQFALELLKTSPAESEDLLSDLETCLEKALAEEKAQSNAPASAGTEPSAEKDEEGDWMLVMVDVLLALGAREDTWWRTVLQPAARQLSRRISAQCANNITDVLLRDDVLQPDDNEEDEEEEMEHDGAQGEERKGEDVDEQEQEESEKEDEDVDEEDSGDESDGEEESDDDGDNRDGTRLDVIKTALLAAMMPTSNSTSVSEDLAEDMDAVPIEELRLMDKRMAVVLREHIKKPSTKKKFSLKSESAQILQYRNRALDLVEGLVQGSPLPSVLLGSVVLPLLRALEVHDGMLMMPLANRIRDVLKEARNVKKWDQSDSVNDVQLLDYLEEVFALAPKVPECCYGVVALLRYSMSRPTQDNASSPVMVAYIKHVRDMLQSRKINKSVVVEPLNLDIPALRTQIIKTILEETFPTTTTTPSCTGPTDCSSNTTDADSNTTDTGSVNTDALPSAADAPNSGISKGRRIVGLDLLKEVLTKTLTAACTELSKQERTALGDLGRNIEQYFNASEELFWKELEPISLLLKLIRKHPASSGCVDWVGLGRALRAFISRVSPDLVGKKKLKRNVDRLATIVLQREDGQSAVIDEEKQTLKRKRKELQREKNQSKKPKISSENQQNSSITKTASNNHKNNPKPQKNKKDASKTKSVDDLFEAEEVFLDANDVDSDQEQSDDNAADDEAREARLAEAKTNKEMKAARKRVLRVKYKANRKLKKAVAKEMRQKLWAEKRERAEAQGATGGNTDKENALPEAGSGRGQEDKKPLQERRPKPQPKAIKKADDALDADLHVGIFSKAYLVE